METWNMHPNCLVWFVVYDICGGVWTHALFLKCFWKLCCLPQVLIITVTSRMLTKVNCVFPISEKLKQTNDNKEIKEKKKKENQKQITSSE